MRQGAQIVLAYGWADESTLVSRAAVRGAERAAGKEPSRLHQQA